MRACLPQAYVFPELSDDPQTQALSPWQLGGGESERYPQVVIEGKSEAHRHDADDGRGTAVGANRFPDDLGITAVARLPYPVRENDGRGKVTGIFFLTEHPPQQRPGAHRGKHVRRDRGTQIPFRALLGICEVDGTEGKGRQVLERRLLLPPIDVVVDRRVSRDVVRHDVLRNTHEAVPALEGQAAHHDAVHRAERVRDAPDAEGDGHDRHQRCARRLGQHPQAVAKVFPEVVHCSMLEVGPFTARFGPGGPGPRMRFWSSGGKRGDSLPGCCWIGWLSSRYRPGDSFWRTELATYPMRLPSMYKPHQRPWRLSTSTGCLGSRI